MDMGLQDKVAIVGCAMGLALEGARVAICARHAGRLEATAQEIREVRPFLRL